MSTPNSGPDSPVALVLGARSWIGYHLCLQLEQQGWRVYGTSSRADVNKPVDQGFYQVVDAGTLKPLLAQLQPQLVVNLLIGISEAEFSIHSSLVDYAQANSAYFVFASSAMALDAYDNQPLVESLEADAVSDYGKFKARCEHLISSVSLANSLVLRFSSIHGWSPYKDTRTVNLLHKVRAGEEVCVDAGVLQNRLTDHALAETITALIGRKAAGTAHIGAADCSEEVEFLRKLAEIFGYSSSGIIERNASPRNLAVVPGIGLHPDGEIYERETLKALSLDPRLQSYKNTN